MRKLILFAVIAIFLAIPFIFWLRALESGVSLGLYLNDAGRFLALTGFVLILFQYVLSSRIRFVERGIGLDRLFIIHRRFGLVGLILVFFHPILLFLSAKVQGYDNPLTPLKILGVITLVILCVVAGVAILYRRLHLKYETWKNIHRAGYVVFVFGFIHSFRLGSEMQKLPLKILWIVMAAIYLAVLVYKIAMRFHVRKHPFEVDEVTQETQDTWSLYFKGRKLAYKPGQFMVIRLRRNGKTSESHPFTISSSPTQDRLSISVKSVGDFTATIGDTKPADIAYIDVPYGIFSFLNHDSDNLVFVAGGIGITPLMSMLRYIHDSDLKRNVTLIWGNKADKDIVFREELGKMEGEMPSLKVVHIMSKQEDWQGEKGYVDAEKIKKHVDSLQESEFFICGPPVMMNSVIKVLKSLGVSKGKIHYEKFALR